MSALNEIYEALDKANDAGTRYVLDIKGSLSACADDETKFRSLESECDSKAAPVLKPSDGGLDVLSIAKSNLYMKYFMKPPPLMAAV